MLLVGKSLNKIKDSYSRNYRFSDETPTTLCKLLEYILLLMSILHSPNYLHLG